MEMDKKQAAKGSDLKYKKPLIPFVNGFKRLFVDTYNYLEILYFQAIFPIPAP